MSATSRTLSLQHGVTTWRLGVESLPEKGLGGGGHFKNALAAAIASVGRRENARLHEALQYSIEFTHTLSAEPPALALKLSAHTARGAPLNGYINGNMGVSGGIAFSTIT